MPHLIRNTILRITILPALYVAMLILTLFPMFQPLQAGEEYWALIVHGGGVTQTSYENGVLRVAFRHSTRPAGDSLHYEKQVPRGQAAWPDRPMLPQEPSVLFQTMPEANAGRVMNELNGGGYWMFYCRNTGRGFFEVYKSELVRASVRID